MVVGHLRTDIESIDIVQVFLHGTCLFEITDLVKSPMQLIMVTIVFPNGGCDLPPSIEPMLVRLPLLQRISFRT